MSLAPGQLKTLSLPLLTGLPPFPPSSAPQPPSTLPNLTQPQPHPHDGRSNTGLVPASSARPRSAVTAAHGPTATSPLARAGLQPGQRLAHDGEQAGQGGGPAAAAAQAPRPSPTAQLLVLRARLHRRLGQFGSCQRRGTAGSGGPPRLRRLATPDWARSEAVHVSPAAAAGRRRRRRRRSGPGVRRLGQSSAGPDEHSRQPNLFA